MTNWFLLALGLFASGLISVLTGWVVSLIFFLCLTIYMGYCLAKEFSHVAELKGYPDKKYFWIAFLVPFAGYLLIIALPDRKTVSLPDRESNRQGINYSNNELPRL